MEKSRRKLKSAGILVLMFTIESIIELVAQFLLTDFNDMALPEGLPANTWLIAKIVALAILIIPMIPSIYVGIKGVKVANDPDYSRAHIVWAVIILIFKIFELASAVLLTLAGEDPLAMVGYVVLAFIDVIIYINFIKWAKRVYNEF